MTPEEYFKAKNIIIKDAIGIELLPDSVIVEMKPTKEMVDDLHAYINEVIEEGTETSLLRGWNCLYCAEYNNSYPNEIDCAGCPLDKAGDNCFKDGSTYRKCVDIIEADDFDRTDIKDMLLGLAINFVENHRDLYDPYGH